MYARSCQARARVAPDAAMCAGPSTDCKHQLLDVASWGFGWAQLSVVRRLTGPQLVPSSCGFPLSGAWVLAMCRAYMGSPHVYRGAPTADFHLRGAPYHFAAANITRGIGV